MAVLGNAQFRKNKFHEAKFSKVELGDNRIVGSILREGEELQIDVKGSLLDLTALLELEEPEQSKYKRGTPFKLNLALDNVEITRGRFLRNVTSTFFNDGLVWSNIALASNIDGDKEFSIEFFPSEGKRFLRVKSNDAGEMLRIFDIYEDMSGGQLDMTAQFEDMSVDSKVTGKGVIKDFRLVDAPILARLLSIASITGIPDQLGAGGITFQKFNAPFVLNDGLLEVREAKASGLSLGITASGVFDLESETIDIKGSLAPLDTVNSLLGEIPVVGRLFSGGEKGGSVFAAEYTMSGPTDDPEIKTNPLSALTPGIFRKLFNILPGVGLGKKTPVWADPGDIN